MPSAKHNFLALDAKTCLPLSRGQAGSFRARIMNLVEEHERIEVEHYQLHKLLNNLQREGSKDGSSLDIETHSLPFERHESDLAPEVAPHRGPTPQALAPQTPVPEVVSHWGPTLQVPALQTPDDRPPDEELCIAEVDAQAAGTCENGATQAVDSGINELPVPPSDNAPRLSRLESAFMQSQQNLSTHTSSANGDGAPSNTSSKFGSEGTEGKKKKHLFQSNSLESASLSARTAKLLVRSHYFETLVSVIIMINVAYMGWSANYLATHKTETRSMKVVDLVFCIIYTCEVLVRIAAWGHHYFCGAEREWNLFDLALVIQNIFEELTYWIGFSFLGGSAAFLRAMRLCKLIKMLRVVRLMKSMREMRLILFSIMGSIKGMFWSLILIAGVLYMFALIFVQACADHLQDTSGDDLDSKVNTKLVYYFGSVQGAMSSLFVAVTGGMDWLDMAEPLLSVGGFYYGVFQLYIAFFFTVIMNTITALFVETTFTNAHKDHQFTVQNILEKKSEYLENLTLLFEEADENGDGLISTQEFCDKLRDPKMCAFAESLDIEVDDAKHFFDVISDGGKRKVTLEAFVVACVKMKGQALSLDLQDLIMRQIKNNTEQNENTQHFRVCLDDIQSDIKAMQSALQIETKVAKDLQSDALRIEKMQSMHMQNGFNPQYPSWETAAS